MSVSCKRWRSGNSLKERTRELGSGAQCHREEEEGQWGRQGSCTRVRITVHAAAGLSLSWVSRKSGQGSAKEPLTGTVFNSYRPSLGLVLLPWLQWRNQGFKISQAAESRLNTHTSVTKLVLSSLHHTASPLKMNIWNKEYPTFWQLMASEARYLCKETTAYVRLTFVHEYSQTCLPHSHRGGGSVTKLCPTLENPWTVAQEAPLDMEFSRQEYCSELPFPSKGDLSSPGLLYCRWSLAL